MASTAEIAPGYTYGQLVTTGGVESRLGSASGGPGYINSAALTTIPVVGNGTAGTGDTGWGNTGVGIIVGPGLPIMNQLQMEPAPRSAR